MSTVQVDAATEVRPFRFNAREQELDELRRRILATRWPEPETVPDESQGVRLATIQELAQYWATDYDWRLFVRTLPPYGGNRWLG